MLTRIKGSVKSEASYLRFHDDEPTTGISLHSAPVNVSYREGFGLLDPSSHPRGLDFPFAVVAHEVAHQWWGNLLTPADVEGAALLTEGLAWYSAIEVVEASLGATQLEELLRAMREAYLRPQALAAVPLLRASEGFVAYRRGPFAIYALREYVGAEPINAALRRLLAAHGDGNPPLPTSLDLYRELHAATPDSLHYLLGDLFERNTSWQLEATSASAEPVGDGRWRVSLDVHARKVVVDEAGAEVERKMDDVIEIGVYGADGDGEPIYLQRHRVRSGPQRITIMVPATPARAGIDPRNLLIDIDVDDNTTGVERPG